MANMMLRRKQETGDLFMNIFIFLLIPFLAFLNACRNPQNKYNRWIIVAYFGVLGFSRKLNELGDAKTWTDMMISFSGQGLKAVMFSIYESYYNIGYILIIYLLSHIKYTAVIWSIIYMLTASLSLFIYDSVCIKSIVIKNGRQNFNKIILFLFFLFFIPMTSFGVKFWVAMDFFLLGYYLYICKEKKWGMLILLTSALFHYTFAYLIIVFFAWYMINRKPLYIALMIVILPFLYYFSSSFSDAFIESKYEAYASGSLIEQRAWWFQLDKYLTASFSLFILLWLTFQRKYLKNNIDKSMYSFLVIFAFSLIPLIPTMDGLDRFSRVFSFMSLIFFARLNIEGINKTRELFIFSIPIYAYHILTLYVMRKGEWDLDIFYNTLYQFLSGGLMTQIA